MEKIMHSPPFAENCQHCERNSPENSGPVHECRCVCLKSDSLNNHEDGELCLKLTQMRRAWRETDLKENLCFERNCNLKKSVELIESVFPKLIRLWNCSFFWNIYGRVSEHSSKHSVGNDESSNNFKTLIGLPTANSYVRTETEWNRRMIFKIQLSSSMMFQFGKHLRSVYCVLNPDLGPKDTEMTS